MTVDLSRALVIVNPIAGAAGRRHTPDRVALATGLARSCGIDAEVAVTGRVGHARALARAAVAQGVGLCIAWGGDGTVNEVASALAFGPASLGIVPSGSGNGLARELGIPSDPRAAFAIAVAGSDRPVDCGELNGHLFVNVAGVGLDARVAHAFAGLERRGVRRYAEITLRELRRFEADEYTIVADGASVQSRALLVAIANGRQYGNGASIAPRAQVDDGWFDVVIVEDRARWRVLLELPLLFAGQATRVPGVTTIRARQVAVTGTRVVPFHIDGEPHAGDVTLTARIHPLALRVRVP